VKPANKIEIESDVQQRLQLKKILQFKDGKPFLNVSNLDAKNISQTNEK
jgi:hypothetical protein